MDLQSLGHHATLLPEGAVGRGGRGEAEGLGRAVPLPACCAAGLLQGGSRCPGDGQGLHREPDRDGCRAPWTPRRAHSPSPSKRLPNQVPSPTLPRLRPWHLCLTFDLTAGPRHPAPGTDLKSPKREGALGRWASGKKRHLWIQGRVTPPTHTQSQVCPKGANRVGLAGAGVGSPGAVGWTLRWASLLGRNLR